MEAWLEDVEAALALGERLTGGGAGSLVGLRLGALLAGVTAARRDVHSLVAWAPILSGKRFVREVRAMHRVAALEADQNDGFLQAAGFRISDETARTLGKLTFAGTPPRILKEALVIDRSDQPIARLPATDTLGVPVTLEQQSDFIDMMAEPHFTRVPFDTLDVIARWLAGVSPPASTVLDAGVLEEIGMARQALVASPEGKPLTEEFVSIPSGDGSSIFGVLCQPGAPSESVVLMANAGSVHHMGPNRLYVELARALGAIGVSSFRFDMRNLGDARTGVTDEENHPYPSTAVEDVGLAVRWLTRERGLSSCSVAGLCSGAHAAFHAGLELDDPPISNVIAFNPLTFQFEEGMSLETPVSQVTSREANYYRDALRSPASWLRLFRGETSIPYLVRFVGRRISQRAAPAMWRVLRRLRIRPPSPLERDLLRLHARGQHIHFVFSSTDPGSELLHDQAGLTVDRLTLAGSLSTSTISGADHTFSSTEHRHRAICEVCQFVGHMEEQRAR